MMKANKMTLAVVVALFAAPIMVPKAHAISESYRKQLERSGCTQMTDGQGCDIHKTRAQNEASKPKAKQTERAEIAAFLEEHVLAENFQDAYNALEGYGFSNTEPGTWVKDKYTVKVKIVKDRIVSAELK